MWLPPENRKHAASVSSASYEPKRAKPFLGEITRYRPRGLPYAPGRRLDLAPTSQSPEPDEVPTSVNNFGVEAPIAARIETITPLPPRTEAQLHVSVPSPNVEDLEDIDHPGEQAVEAIREIVLFGPDPLANLVKANAVIALPESKTDSKTDAKSTRLEDGETKPEPARRPSLLRFLFETRWWVLVPVCMAMAAIGIIRLHEGPSSIRARDGALVDLVFDNVKAVTEIHTSDTLTPRSGGSESNGPLEAEREPDTAIGDSSPHFALTAKFPQSSAATDEIAHVGALPRAAICAYDGGVTPTVSKTVRKGGANFGAALADAAEAQVRSFVVYNDGYRTLKYPGGDVAPLYGVCSDVVVRAYRALGIDLQQRVHEARVGSPDVSIAHRRTQTLRRLFAREGASLPITDFDDDYLPGDVISYDRPQNRGVQDHIAIVSNVRGPSGRFMIVHNRGFGPQIEDALFVDRISGHYRYQGRALKANTQRPGKSAEKNLKRAKKQRAFREARKKRRTES